MAANHLERKISMGTKHADVYYLAGELQRLLGNPDEAEAHLLNAIAMKVHTPYSYYSLGLVFIDLGNYSRAIPVLKHFATLKETSEAYYALGK